MPGSRKAGTQFAVAAVAPAADCAGGVFDGEGLIRGKFRAWSLGFRVCCSLGSGAVRSATAHPK